MNSHTHIVDGYHCSAQIFSGVGFPHPVPDFLGDLPKPTREEAIRFLGRLCSCLALVVTAIQRYPV